MDDQLQAMLQQMSAAGVHPGGGGGGNLVDFKAGRLTKANTTVTADTRKGKVSLYRADGLLHFKWETRPGAKTENDWIMFPESAKWEKVPECKDGRVFLLRMTASNDKHFFWMQEPSDEKDEDNFKKINDLLKGSAAGAAGGGTAGLGGASGAGADPFGLGGPAGGQGALDQNAILAMIQQAQAQSLQSSDSSSSSAAPVTPESTFLASADDSLHQVLNPDLVIPVLAEQPDLMEKLLTHLPEGQRTREALRENLRSAQLQQTLGRLQNIINGGEMASLMQQMGLPPSNDIGANAFLQAIQKYAEDQKSKEEGSDKKEEKDQDGDAKMEE
eukprot:255237_1